MDEGMMSPETHAPDNTDPANHLDLEGMEVDENSFDHEPFNAIDFIALYRIAERESFRDPTNAYWSTRLLEAQANVVEHVQRNGPCQTLDKGSREALDLLVRVLEREEEYRREEKRWLAREQPKANENVERESKFPMPTEPRHTSEGR